MEKQSSDEAHTKYETRDSFFILNAGKWAQTQM